MEQNKGMSSFSFKMMTIIMSIRAFFRNTKEEVVRSGVSAGQVVLDFGCGIGLSSIPAAEIVGPRGKVYALDIHPLAVKEVENKAKKRGLANVETILSSKDTGLPDETVDTTLLFNVLPMIADRAGVIKEIYRVMKSGGTLAVTTGLGAKAYAGEAIDPASLEQLLKDNGPFKLKEHDDNFYIFEKI